MKNRVELYSGYYESPIGQIRIEATDEGVTSVLFVDRNDGEEVHAGLSNRFIEQCLAELDQYFSGKREPFTVAVATGGTAFQRQVWACVVDIPHGGTASYSDIAARIGSDKAVRAVGTAIGRNQLALLIPCHRIVGKNNALTGYAWGLSRKEWLLRHEAEQAHRNEKKE